ncbi:MAG: cyclic nucleotide-binding domain-containing protein [Moorea sp. SIO2B7]|nr:cyclic nucleotide-binding domain-containing protein [Moorena sp. SIO2B7]
MTLTARETIHYLRTAPILSGCSVQDLSRLIPFVSEHNFQPNQTIFQSGSVADKLYIVVEGTVRLLSDKRLVDEISQGSFGEEAAIGMEEKYILSGIAVSNTIVLSINKDALQKITASNNNLIQEFYQSLLNHYSDDKSLKYKAITHSTNIFASNYYPKILGWLGAIFLPIFVFFIASLPRFEIPEDIQLFLTVFSTALVLWTFNLVSEFIPAIIIIFALLVLDVAPPSVVLSGFSSSSFFLALSIFALGAVLTTSGLTYRLVLIILKAAPQSQFSYGLTLFMMGLFLTPILPSANGRTQLLTPLLMDMVEAWQLHKIAKLLVV